MLAYFVAYAHVLQRNLETIWPWVERALHAPDTRTLLLEDPVFEPLWNQRRFADLLDDVIDREMEKDTRNDDPAYA